MQTIVVVFLVCVAMGYLVWRYVKRTGNEGSCECENFECPMNQSGRLRVDDGSCEAVNCENRKYRPLG